jgi:hypothetical protein
MDYEVRCHDCDVSYPVGTKRCIYCGARPSVSPQPRSTMTIQDYFEVGETPAEEESHKGSKRSIRDEEEEGTPPGMLARMLGGLAWVLLFAAISAYRACTG